MNKPPVLIDLKGTSWEGLRKQKHHLLDLIRDIRARRCPTPFDSEHAKSLDGIVQYLDYIQDEAAKQLGEAAVFGVRCAGCVDPTTGKCAEDEGPTT